MPELSHPDSPSALRPSRYPSLLVTHPTGGPRHRGVQDEGEEAVRHCQRCRRSWACREGATTCDDYSADLDTTSHLR